MEALRTAAEDKVIIIESQTWLYVGTSKFMCAQLNELMMNVHTKTKITHLALLSYLVRSVF